jgi:hypothetical protein
MNEAAMLAAAGIGGVGWDDLLGGGVDEGRARVRLNALTWETISLVSDLMPCAHPVHTRDRSSTCLTTFLCVMLGDLTTCHS